MIIHREIRSSYHHKPKVQGGGLLLFIMVMMVEMLEKMETTPAAPRRSFPPPICSSRSFVSWFSVSAALSSESRRGTIFIVVFRSRRRLGKKDRWQRSHEGPDGGSHAAKESGRVDPPSSGPRASVCSLPSLPRFVPSKKLMLVNFQVIWTSFGSLKHQNIENRVFCQCRVNYRKIGKL